MKTGGMRLFALFILLMQTYGATAQADGRIANRYIVMLAPGHTLNQLLENETALKPVKQLSPRMNIWLLERNTTTGADDFLKQLNLNRHVLMAQYDHTFEERGLIPNDPLFTEQWNMLNTGANGGTPGADIEATEAWALHTGNTTAYGDTLVVAVIDGRPDLAHEDIDYFTNYNEIPGNGVDDDANGYIDDVNGWNVPDSSGNTGGNNGHATHLAGIVGAKGNNSVGVAGVCWGAKVLPVVYGNTTESNVVACYDYVREMRILYNSTFGSKGAFVVATNSSFGKDGGPNGSRHADFPIWCAMYDSMGTVGILSAAATANRNWDIDIQDDVPTACPSNYLIAVTNTTRTDQRNTGSAFGAINVDLGAPGTSVQSTLPANTYGNSSGTSMAAPHVAGAIAAMYANACKALIDLYYQRPDSVTLLMKQYLLDGAEWVSSMNGITYTGGRLNLYRAVSNVAKFNCDSCAFDAAITKTNLTCKSAADGNLMANITPAGTGYSYVWSTADTTTQLSNQGPGFYTLQVTDTAGCTRFASAELHNPDSIVIEEVNVVPAGTSNGSISVTATAGNEPLMYSLTGDTFQHSSIFVIDTNGNYTVYIKNTSGCVVRKSVVISGLNKAPQLLQAEVFPNPAGNFLNIKLQQPVPAPIQLTITNHMGQIVWQSNALQTVYTISTAGWAGGIYQLSMQTANSLTTRRVVLAR